jgi:hypothetical protein
LVYDQSISRVNLGLNRCEGVQTDGTDLPGQLVDAEGTKSFHSEDGRSSGA